MHLLSASYRCVSLKTAKVDQRNSQAPNKELNSITHKLQSSKYVIKVKAKLYN